jgi:spore maturation protein SpmA
MNVFLEALIVGIFFLPVYWITEKAGLTKWVTLFLSGVLFHLLAEVSGVNHAYVLSKR